MAPQRSYVDMSAFERLKFIQTSMKKQWNGIQCDHSGRPGTANIANKKMVSTVTEQFLEDEDYFRQLQRLFQILKEIEDEKNNNNAAIKSSQNFFGVQNQNKGDSSKPYGDFHSFKAIKEN